ncbi:unnamed protein product [Linum trigynum]|uniref:Uncharacterized protein n=1 Tax=Linum trigynum TaxID=586398 RepID=A0AAV2EF31_9ROSI
MAAVSRSSRMLSFLIISFLLLAGELCHNYSYILNIFHEFDLLMTNLLHYAHVRIYMHIQVIGISSSREFEVKAGNHEEHGNERDDSTATTTAMMTTNVKNKECNSNKDCRGKHPPECGGDEELYCSEEGFCSCYGRR